MKKIVVISGPPGSGKSHTVSKMDQPTYTYDVVSGHRGALSMAASLRDAVPVFDNVGERQLGKEILVLPKVIVLTTSKNPFSFTPQKKDVEYKFLSLPTKDDIMDFLEKRGLKDSDLMAEIAWTSSNWHDVMRGVEMGAGMKSTEAERTTESRISDVVDRGRRYNRELNLLQFDANVLDPVGVRAASLADALWDSRLLVLTKKMSKGEPWSRSMRSRRK